MGHPHLWTGVDFVLWDSGAEWFSSPDSLHILTTLWDGDRSSGRVWWGEIPGLPSLFVFSWLWEFLG
jgi:hypothetical protein